MIITSAWTELWLLLQLLEWFSLLSDSQASYMSDVCTQESLAIGAAQVDAAQGRDLVQFYSDNN